MTKSIKILDTNKKICEIALIENENKVKYFSKITKAIEDLEIICCTDDNEIKLYDLNHEVCIANLEAHKNYIWCLEYLHESGEIIR